MSYRYVLALFFGLHLITSPAYALSPDLHGVLSTVRANTAKSMVSYVVMDLDETVIDSHLRKYLAYRAATEDLCGTAAATLRAPKSENCEKALGLSMHDIYGAANGYSQPELMAKLGITDEVFTRDLYRMRRSYEDSPRWFGMDTLLPGVSGFVRDLKRAGARIYFVSSREAESLSEATLDQLLAHGLIESSDKPQVVLRAKGIRSIDFKRDSAREILASAQREGAAVVALFENEPGNLAAWMESFPGARAFFVRGSFATPAPIPAAAISISSYR